MSESKRILLSSHYEGLFGEMLAKTAPAKGVRTQRTLSAFWPTRGDEYEHELMIVGRATNGWGEISKGWIRTEALEQRRREAIINSARACSENDTACPMMWVADKVGSYNPKNSAFWRVACRVLTCVSTGRDTSPDDRWPSRLAWSNLCKIAPADAGNPSSGLYDAQLEGCADLLRQEVSEFKPRRVLVMTGWDWFEEFERRLGLKAKRLSDGYVEAVASDDGCKWVVVPHPMTRPEDRLVDQAVSAFERDRI